LAAAILLARLFNVDPSRVTPRLGSHGLRGRKDLQRLLCRRPLRSRKPNGESGPFRVGRSQTDLAAMACHYRPGDEQPQTDDAPFGTGVPGAADQRLEHRVPSVQRDWYATVVNGLDHVLRTSECVHAHGAAVPVLDRISQEVGKNLGEAIAVPVTGDIAIRLETHHCGRVCCLNLQRNFLTPSRDPCVRASADCPAKASAGQVKQIVNHSVHALRAAEILEATLDCL
jgi:hypothetical protein